MTISNNSKRVSGVANTPWVEYVGVRMVCHLLVLMIQPIIIIVRPSCKYQQQHKQASERASEGGMAHTTAMAASSKSGKHSAGRSKKWANNWGSKLVKSSQSIINW
jgi:hypothetical protein